MNLAPPRGATTLTTLLGSGAMWVLALGVARSLGGYTAIRTLDLDPGVRVVGLSLAAMGWWIARSCVRVAIGLRRAVAWLAAGSLVVAGTMHLAGPDALALIPMRPWPGAFSLAGSVLLGAATAYAWWTSPARR